MKINTPQVSTNDCWLWARAKHPLGYGNMRISGKTQYAHRVVYEALVGEIPAGYSLDHLCRASACVNPDHLEPVTHKENVLRGVGPTAENSQKTHCQHGHEFTNENTRITVAGGRLCRTCDKIYKEKWHKKFSEANRALGLTARGIKPTRPNRIGARV